MKKNMYLGIGKNHECCILESHLTFSTLTDNILEIESNDFTHSSVDYGGHGDIYKTLLKDNLEITGRGIILPVPIEFNGADYDLDRKYEWSFKVYEIMEVRKKMISNTCGVKTYVQDSYERGYGDDLIVESDKCDNNMVHLVFEGKSIKVVGSDLIQAIKNCMDINRFW